MSGHIWGDPDLSTCELCGDKDWMADKECSKSKDLTLERAVNRIFEDSISTGKPVAMRPMYVILPSGASIEWKESKTPLTGSEGLEGDD